MKQFLCGRKLLLEDEEVLNVFQNMLFENS